MRAFKKIKFNTCKPNELYQCFRQAPGNASGHAKKWDLFLSKCMFFFVFLMAQWVCLGKTQRLLCPIKRITCALQLSQWVCLAKTQRLLCHIKSITCALQVSLLSMLVEEYLTTFTVQSTLYIFIFNFTIHQRWPRLGVKSWDRYIQTLKIPVSIWRLELRIWGSQPQYQDGKETGIKGFENHILIETESSLKLKRNFNWN